MLFQEPLFALVSVCPSLSALVTVLLATRPMLSESQLLSKLGPGLSLPGNKVCPARTLRHALVTARATSPPASHTLPAHGGHQPVKCQLALHPASPCNCLCPELHALPNNCLSLSGCNVPVLPSPLTFVLLLLGNPKSPHGCNNK